MTYGRCRVLRLTRLFLCLLLAGAPHPVRGVSLKPDVEGVLESFVAERVAALELERVPEPARDEFVGLKQAWTAAKGTERPEATHALYGFLLTHHLHLPSENAAVLTPE